MIDRFGSRGQIVQMTMRATMIALCFVFSTTAAAGVTVYGTPIETVSVNDGYAGPLAKEARELAKKLNKAKLAKAPLIGKGEIGAVYKVSSAWVLKVPITHDLNYLTKEPADARCATQLLELVKHAYPERRDFQRVEALDAVPATVHAANGTEHPALLKPLVTGPTYNDLQNHFLIAKVEGETKAVGPIAKDHVAAEAVDAVKQFFRSMHDYQAAHLDTVPSWISDFKFDNLRWGTTPFSTEQSPHVILVDIQCFSFKESHEMPTADTIYSSAWRHFKESVSSWDLSFGGLWLDSYFWQLPAAPAQDVHPSLEQCEKAVKHVNDKGWGSHYSLYFTKHKPGTNQETSLVQMRDPDLSQLLFTKECEEAACTWCFNSGARRGYCRPPGACPSGAVPSHLN